MGGWRAVLSTLTEGRDLTGPQAAASMGQILAGDATPGPDRRLHHRPAHQGRDRRRDVGNGRCHAGRGVTHRVAVRGARRHRHRGHRRSAQPARACPQCLDHGLLRRRRRRREGLQARQPQGLVDERVVRSARGLGRPARARRPGGVVVCGPGRRRVLLRPGVPSRHALRRARARRARRAHRVQLPRPVVEPGQGATSSDRRERRPHGAHRHRCPPSPPRPAGDGRARSRRHGRADHHGTVDGARAERRNGAAPINSIRPTSDWPWFRPTR